METKTTPCNKTYFSDEKQAQIYIDKLANTSTRKSVPVRSYLCSKCSCWHLTSKGDNNIVRNTFARVEELEIESQKKDELISELQKKLSIKESVISALHLDFELMRESKNKTTLKNFDKYKIYTSNLESQILNQKTNIKSLEEKLRKLSTTNENYLKRIMEQNVIIHKNK